MCRGCSEGKRTRNMKLPPGARRGDVKEKKKERKQKKKYERKRKNEKKIK